MADLSTTRIRTPTTCRTGLTCLETRTIWWCPTHSTPMTCDSPLRQAFPMVISSLRTCVTPSTCCTPRGSRAPKMLSVGLHCRIVGRPARAAALERFRTTCSHTSRCGSRVGSILLSTGGLFIPPCTPWAGAARIRRAHVRRPSVTRDCTMRVGRRHAVDHGHPEFRRDDGTQVGHARAAQHDRVRTVLVEGVPARLGDHLHRIRVAVEVEDRRSRTRAPRGRSVACHTVRPVPTLGPGCAPAS